MNTETKEDLPVQRLRFNAAILDERLRKLMGDAERYRSRVLDVLYGVCSDALPDGEVFAGLVVDGRV